MVAWPGMVLWTPAFSVSGVTILSAIFKWGRGRSWPSGWSVGVTIHGETQQQHHQYLETLYLNHTYCKITHMINVMYICKKLAKLLKYCLDYVLWLLTGREALPGPVCQSGAAPPVPRSPSGLMQFVRSSIQFIWHIFIGFQLELGCLIFAPYARLDVVGPALLHMTRKSSSVSRGRPKGKAVITGRTWNKLTLSTNKMNSY